ncbi:uncharacterized protein E0L32_005234 [Thyridium curvatum]|uniref:Mannan endo-1,6-alpha-mannosidase n=1 Tax=Thyridium curvatum TaxID=1093900 RepID=A0A507AX64_9PEZI|nr:uncharacterized protein E0L32_005234 [Thyridium curvatum]TPX14542.1 hypothetical protein E0L32_005234 [Thyridium curvatum]
MLVKNWIWPLLAASQGAQAALEYTNLCSPSPLPLESIKKAAAIVAKDLLDTYYNGDKPGFVPGILPGPPPDGDYYWWQGGALWGTLLDYWHYTGDTQFNPIVKRAMMFQVGENADYNPRNWSASMGNDDQSFWAFSAMLATELGFEDPPKDKPQWAALVQAVYNEQTAPERRVTTPGHNCEWGLRWQVFPANNGFDYINTIANGCYFNIAARLARYFGNMTYAENAERTWNLITRLKYVDDQYNVYDGAHEGDQCTKINKFQFSYNAVILLQGSAYMWNMTQKPEWEQRINGLLDNIIKVFFPDKVAFEVACEHATCTTDMESFKGYLHRWLASTTQLAPFTRDKIMPVLKSSTAAAVKLCTGGANGRMCGFKWSTGVFDETGAMQQQNVIAALTSLLVGSAKGPLTNSTGGTSVGNPNAGVDTPLTIEQRFGKIGGGDRAGAAILTILIVGAASVMFWYMGTD